MVQDGSTVFIEPLQETHLFRVQLLINMHLSTMAPGWGLPETFIARCLHRNPYQETIDPWVRERMTLCALQKQRVVAAAHLLRYGNGPEVNPYYQNVGDLAWFLAWPNAGEAAIALLAASSPPGKSHASMPGMLGCRSVRSSACRMCGRISPTR